MENETYAARLRYLPAADVEDTVVDYRGMNVHGADGQKLGEVDGFIIDSQARRVYYIVVDSGGWFTSRRLLLPIGHASLAADRTLLQADVGREALRRLPEFDADRFGEFSDGELRAFERDTVIVCCPNEPLEDVSATTWGYHSRWHYTQPEWWRRSHYAPERLRDLSGAFSAAADPGAPLPRASMRGPSSIESSDRDLVMARDRAAVGEMSPDLDERARPGDVIGIQTGGEVTAIGDTAEDEDKRRMESERSLAGPRSNR
jgi:hypothetical protein